MGTTSLTDAAGHAVGGRWFGQSSFAMHSLATDRNVVKVDDDVSLELLGPLGCGMQTGAASVLVALNARPGSSIAIFGTGAVGLAAVMAAKIAGCTTVIGVDRHARRLALAEQLGATHAIDGADPDIVARIVDLTGDGVQLAFDTTGSSPVIINALSTLRPTGVLGLVAARSADLVIAPNLLANGRSVLSIIQGDAVPQLFIPRLLALWRQGRFPFDTLIETFPLDAVDAAEQASLDGDVVKSVLLPKD
jgi:aryl-alcohol dehydrogenase